MAKKIKLNDTQNPRTTLREVFDDYISQCKVRNLSEATLKSYKWQFSIFKKFLPSETRVSDIDETSIKRVINEMLGDGSKPVSINTMLRHMNSVFNYAYSIGLLNKSPRVQFLKTQEESKDCYTEQEVITLLKKPDNKKSSFREFRTWVIVNTLVATGIRLSTVSHIKIRDIDFDNCLLKLSTLKNKKVQILPISKALVPVLKEYIRVRKGTGDEYLFCTETGTKLSESTIYHDIVVYNTTRGVQKTSVHLFRHTFAKHFVIAGGDPIRLQKWLGHSTLEMTRHYCNLYDTDLQDGSDRFNLLDSISTRKLERIKLK